MKIRSMRVMRVLLLGLLLSSFAVAAETEGRQRRAGVATVFWLSIDGVRSDYVGRAETPNLDRLMAEGASSRELRPIFPSLTFPAHVSLATGTDVSGHGVPLNTFYDRQQQRVFAFPPWAFMLEAEPIWLTAARQGVRTAVLDWPLSHDQRGEVRTAFYDERYRRGLSDRQRIERALGVWEDGEAEEAPYRLVMAYMVGPDSAGHVHGPESDEVIAEMQAVDGLIGELIERATALVDRQHAAAEDGAGEPGPLYVVITTDHGMAAVETIVHMGLLTGVEGDERVEQVTGGNVGHLFFEIDDAAEREAAMAEAIAAAEARPFARAYRQAELPEAWGYRHATRVGDVVIVLESGYSFSRRSPGVTSPAAEHGGPLGMHGYHPSGEAGMLGPLVIWRYPQPLRQAGSPAIDLGPVDARQVHPTVAELLGIEAGEQATEAAIDLP